MVAQNNRRACRLYYATQLVRLTELTRLHEMLLLCKRWRKSLECLERLKGTHDPWKITELLVFPEVPYHLPLVQKQELRLGELWRRRRCRFEPLTGPASNVPH
jgi:hypothetical protein